MITTLFELVSFGCIVEIQKLLACAPLSPVPAAFCSDDVEEKDTALNSCSCLKIPTARRDVSGAEGL